MNTPDFKELNARIRNLEEELQTVKVWLAMLEVRESVKISESSMDTPPPINLSSSSDLNAAKDIPEWLSSNEDQTPPPLKSGKDLFNETKIPAITPSAAPTRQLDKPVSIPIFADERPWVIEAKKVLEDLSLMPPASDENFEIKVGTWWFTRIGAMLAVIATVFLGVYVSQDSPYLRFAEMAGISVGMVLLGCFLERKLIQFGAVIFGGGLAMMDFTAFAGYAVASMKITDSASVSATAQFVMAAGILLVAQRRKSPTLGTMSVLLGLVSCFFATLTDLNASAIVMSLALSVVASVLLVMRNRQLAYYVAIPASYLIVNIATSSLVYSPDSFLPFFFYTLFVIALGSVFFFADIARHLSGYSTNIKFNRVFQVANFLMAFALAQSLATQVFGMPIYYICFTMGAIAMAFCVISRFAGNDPILMHVFFAKATALIAIGSIDYFDGNARWIVLLVEAFLLLYQARRYGYFLSYIGAPILWVISVGLFCADFLPAVFRQKEILSLDGLLAFVNLFVSGYFAVAYTRFCVKWQPSKKDNKRFVDSPDWVNGLIILWVIVAGYLLFLAPYLVAVSFAPEYLLPATVALCSAILLCAAYAGRHWAPAIPPLLSLLWVVVPLTFKNSDILRLDASFSPFSLLWKNALPCLIVMSAGAWAVGVFSKRLKDVILKQDLKEVVHMVELVLSAAAVLLLQFTIAATFTAQWYLPVALLIAAIILALNSKFRSEVFPWVAPLVMLASLLLVCDAHRFDGLLFFHTKTASEYGDWVSMLLALALMVPLARFGKTWPTHLRSKQVESWWMDSCGIVLTALAIMTIALLFDIHPNAMSAMMVLGLYLTVSSKKIPLPRASLWAILAVVAADLEFVRTLRNWPEGGYTDFLILFQTIFSAAACLALVWTARWWASIEDKKIRTALIQVAGINGLVLLFVMFLRQEGGLSPYTTVCWGTSAILWITLGLFWRCKLLRLVGMAALTLCIARVFMVDITSSLYRIYAFGLVGIVLLTVGYVYTRLRDSISKWDMEK